MTTADPHVEYAFWTPPGTTFKITYPLGVFHEIDFQVNEGYRRIPHGGVETGGLLFGHAEGDSVRIEAFRNIECEHASGPSFVLSERDLTQLKEQITTAPTDPELHGLEVVGWFIAHTRSPLKMNDRECTVFDELFPEPGKITLLIKPERFQPTRFGFLVRGSDHEFVRDATQRAIILPLPGRSSRGGEGPIPSIPAPVDAAVPSSPVKPGSKPGRTPASTAATRPSREANSLLNPPERTGVEQHLTETRARQAMESSVVPSVLAPNPVSSIPETRARLSERVEAQEPADVRPSHRQTRRLDREGTRSNLRLLLVLVLAAALGCAVGYWAYSRLPAATIALNVHAAQSTLLISWPADQTRDAVYASLRVDDGQPVALSPEEKSTGEAEITPTSDNVKVELIAQHWMRDSRGIIRYVKPLPPIAPRVETPPVTRQPAVTESR